MDRAYSETGMSWTLMNRAYSETGMSWTLLDRAYRNRHVVALCHRC